MEIRHLRYFVAVAEELHFARAAQKVHIAQSPLSRAIRDLEADLGVRLFERNSRCTCLTSAGKTFLKDAKIVLGIIEQSKVNVKNAANQQHDCLNIALAESLSESRLIKAVSHYQYPSNPVRLLTLSMQAVVDGLRNDTIDIGILHSQQVHDGLTTEVLWHDSIVAVVSRNHPIAAIGEISFIRLSAMPLIFAHPEHWQGANEYVMGLFNSMNLTPIIAGYATGHESMLTLVAGEYGIGFALASHVAFLNRSDIRICTFSDLLPAIPICALWKGPTPSPRADHFMKLARTITSD
ncbi:LysR family transcriptional regulator [Pseudomonas caspiana]